jgi:hypothetical protein
MVMNSTKFIFYKDLKKLCADLKAVYSQRGSRARRFGRFPEEME